MVRRVSVVSVRGPLEGVADRFGEELTARGYTPLSAANQLRLLAHLSRWVESESLTVAELTEATLDRFLAARREAGYTGWLSRRGLGPLVGMLRAEGLIPAAPVPEQSGLEVLLAEFALFLRSERGLAEATIESRCRVARRFLAGSDGEVAGLTAAEVAAYVASACPSMGVGTAKLEVTGLRSVLRFLHVSGRVEMDLSPAVLGAAGWRHTGLPKALAETEVVALFAACDPGRPSGRRDRAILGLLVRLGLRRSEVARLCLEDIDWRAGEVTIAGKGSRVERLPLPVEVGEALVDYLQHERPPRTAERVVFLNPRVPLGPMTGGAVGGVVQQLARRAGLGSIGAHRLRHTAATRMLRAGADLVEVGQLLRHRNLSTTTIYAKVDLDRLHRLARPWPRPVVADDERARRRRSLALPWPVPVRFGEVAA